MKSKKIKKILTYIIVPFMVAVFIFDIFTCILGERLKNKVIINKEEFSKNNSLDRIHFLNTGNSDCILLESNGHFALIDCGEGSDNPRKKAASYGYEQSVLDYLKLVCADENGRVRLDFILGTHWHYDHVGGFHKIINSDFIEIDKAYFKPLTKEYTKKYELTRWGLEGIAEKIIDDLENKGVALETQIPREMAFGDFTLNFFNLEKRDEYINAGENCESIGILVTKGEKNAFLCADITKTSGSEDAVINELKKVNLLKIGHHGYFGSSSVKFLKVLEPDIAIVTNYAGKIYPNVKWNLTLFARTPVFGTPEYDGIIASFTDEGEIELTCGK